MIGRLIQIGAQTSTLRNPAGWLTDALTGGQTLAGTVVNEETALSLSGIFRAVDNLASHLAMLPLPVFERTGENEKQRRNDHPLTRVLNLAPNAGMTAFDVKKVMQAHLLLWGNAYAEIGRDPSDVIRGLMPIHPASVVDLRLRGSVITAYVVRDTLTQDEIAIPSSDMIHLRGLGNGSMGYNLISHLARQNLGLQLAIEQYSQAAFGNGTAVNVLLTSDAVKTPEQEQKIVSDWSNQSRGAKNAFKTRFLGGDIKVQNLGMNNEDAQLIESKTFSIRDAARWFNVPPHMLAELSDATFSNITEQALGYVKYSLAPHFENWEQELNSKLFPVSQQDTLFVEFLAEGLLRGDPKTRAEFYQALWGMGSMTINEIRAKENMNGIGPAGDQHFVQLNMTTAEQMLQNEAEQDEDEQDQQASPAGGPFLPSENIKRAYVRTFGEVAARLMRKETKALCSAHTRDSDKRNELIRRFYERFQDEIAAELGPHALGYVELLEPAAANSAPVVDAIGVFLSNYAAKHCDNVTKLQDIGRIKRYLSAEPTRMARDLTEQLPNLPALGACHAYANNSA